jgi:hypothetical protein
MSEEILDFWIILANSSLVFFMLYSNGGSAGMARGFMGLQLMQLCGFGGWGLLVKERLSTVLRLSGLSK